MLAFVSVCAATAGVAAHKQQPISTARTDLVRTRLTLAGSPHGGSRLLSSFLSLLSTRVSHSSSGYFFAFFFGQGILVVDLTVEPSWKLNSEAPGQYPRGQVLGVMMPLTWNSLRLPWTFL
jgi:hypothetical protein